MSETDIKKFFKEYNELERRGTYFWKVLDEAMFHVFNKYRKHNVLEEVFSKVALINRVYRANLHFAGKENIETKIAEAFVKNTLDDVLGPLNIIDSLTSQTIPVLIEMHGRIVTIVREVTKKTHNSFVSKYMHFHFPDIVPIFDQYAYDKSWQLIPHAKKEYSKYDALINYDYAFHCESVLGLINELKDRGVDSPNLKIIDILLYEGIG